MGFMTLNELLPIFICPRCKSSLARTTKGYLCTNSTCVYSGEHCFPVIDGYPVLVDFEQSILGEDGVVTDPDEKFTFRTGSGGPLKKKLLEIFFPCNPVAAKNARHLIELLKTTIENPRILVIGGGTIGNNAEVLYDDQSLQLISFDIYATPLTQFIADGHQIPLASQSVDAVWIQAVLEHVLDPWQVVAEIHRVLKIEGIVYAETPFMQQVHAGAYDFTRFTESGHRWLFRKFDLIDSGIVGGPGTQLLWTADYVTRSIFRSIHVGYIARGLLFWVRFLDIISSADYAADTATSVFFLGRKSGREMAAKEIVGFYKGAQRP